VLGTFDNIFLVPRKRGQTIVDKTGIRRIGKCGQYRGVGNYLDLRVVIAVTKTFSCVEQRSFICIDTKDDAIHFVIGQASRVRIAFSRLVCAPFVELEHISR